MRKFLIRVLVFAVLTIAIDLAFGAIFPFLREKAKGGRTHEEYYIAEECEAEALVFGSSRALHHYVPSVFQESLHLSCFNCGKDGMGSLLAYARFRMLTGRYTPKLVIYDVAPLFDYAADEDNTKYLGSLNPDLGKEGVREAVQTFTDPETRILMNSQMYRYNSHFISYLIDCLVNRHYSDGGYQAIFGRIKTDGLTDDTLMVEKTLEIDTKKMKLIEAMILECQSRGITFVFVMSPVYKGRYPKENLQPLIDMALKHEVPFLDFSAADGIADNADYFQDSTHLNDTGAHIYSKVVAEALIEYGIVPGGTYEN